MGHYFVLGPCLVCHQPFTYNPDLVPSHPARGGLPSTDPADPKEPICESCIAEINAARREAGRPEWTVLSGAYEPAEGFPS